MSPRSCSNGQVNCDHRHKALKTKKCFCSFPLFCRSCLLYRSVNKNGWTVQEEERKSRKAKNVIQSERVVTFILAPSMISAFLRQKSVIDRSLLLLSLTVGRTNSSNEVVSQGLLYLSFMGIFFRFDQELEMT